MSFFHTIRIYLLRLLSLSINPEERIMADSDPLRTFAFDSGNTKVNF